MKKLSQLLMLVAVASFTFSCGGGSASSPEDAVVGFMNALQDLDFGTAKGFATDDTKEALDAMQKMVDMMPKEQMPKNEDKKTLTKDNVKCTVDGDNAKCKMCETPENCEEQELTVVKDGSAWKVKMSKEEMNKNPG
ncbi:MAG: DUF4878 domain-containing protein [Aureispira sp.]|nr:DUF4878 domain-containing protein [Aureispira sp.]